MEINGAPIVAEASVTVESGQIAGLIGPNGSGKSTLLRAVYRHLRPAAGAVLVGGEDVWALSPRRAAARTAAVPQERSSEFDLTVAQTVAMGRTPHKRPYAVDTAEDRAIVADALALVGMERFAHRDFATLSGGEKQRVLVARAVAQRTQLLVLDEPTNHLDIRHQLELLELVQSLGLTTLVAMHDLNLAATYCGRLHVLDAGRLITSGAPAEVLTEQLLRDVFGIGAQIDVNEHTGRLRLSFYPLDRAADRAGTTQS